MSRLNFVILLIVLMMISAWSAQAKESLTLSPNTPIRYIYVRQFQNDSATIESIDPSTQLTTTLFTVQTPSLPSGDYITFLYPQSVLSPDGKSVMLVHGTPMGYDRVLEIVDLESGTSQQSEPFQVYPPHEGRLDTDRPTFYWSPDSHFIAFNRFVDLLEDEPIIKTYLYDVAQNQLRVLNDQQARPLHLAWSPDGQELAVIEADAAQNATSITVYDVGTGEKTKSVLLDDQVPLPRAAYVRDSSLCMFWWSPSGRYFSFLTVCDQSDMESPKEIYVGNWTTETIEPVTDFTAEPIVTGPLQLRTAVYAVNWLPNDDLLISVGHFTPDREFKVHSIVHSARTEQTQQLGEYFVIDAAVTSSRNAVSFSEVTMNEEGIGERGLTVTGRSMATRDISQPLLGCDLAWSPDETLLALWPHPLPAVPGVLTTICRSPKEHLLFLHDNRVIEKQFEIGDTVIPLGWMR